MVEPVSTAVAAVSLVKNAADLYAKLNQLYKSVQDREVKTQLAAMMDSVHEVKTTAVQLEDENRELRERLRFKSDEYTFDGAYFYNVSKPQRPLCPKCHTEEKDAPMSEIDHEYQQRTCLSCSKTVDVPGKQRPRQRVKSDFNPYESD